MAVHHGMAEIHHVMETWIVGHYFQMDAYSYLNFQLSASPWCCFIDANPFAFCCDNCIVC